MKSKKIILRVIKIGGNIIDDPARLDVFLQQFATLQGAKILVHGGGKLATQLAEKLGIPQTLIEGRRVTDAATLDVVTMVYGGLVNKKVVARLQALECPALGVCGADGDLLRARKRPVKGIDYGWAGDINAVNTALIDRWLGQGLTPVVAPLTHDGQGNLLNTNADTIAQEIAQAMGTAFHTELVYIFEKDGVMLDINDPHSRIARLNAEQYLDLKARGIVSEGMIPKLDNAFAALQKGVKKVIIGAADRLEDLLEGASGTSIAEI
jgi:acetylglutamate kinase